ncbi:MAG: YicC family protein [Gammaproteobacteria bacterium]|nr:YicC family protein [Gammaproteobacteria bacterium]
MTAFARVAAKSDELEIVWELKTVNHRYLDISMRMPEALRQLEMKARDSIQQQLGRGKVDAMCRYKLLSGQASDFYLDNDKVSAVIAACNEIELQMGMGQALNAIDILKFPGVTGEKNNDLPGCEEQVLTSLADCIDELQKSRQAEGLRLKALIAQRAQKLTEIVADVRARWPEVVAAVQAKLKQRVLELTQSPDQERLEQELVMIAQKMDVDEELDRLDSHVEELMQTLGRNEPKGRRLDFLMQEFNREANTLGAKSADLATTQAAVELKVLIEQMREQVQNIE